MPVLLLYGDGHPLTGLWNGGVKEPVKSEGRSLPVICLPLLSRNDCGSCVVHGHITAGEYLEFLQGDYKFLTWLRHPLQRICSHYYYWRNQASQPPRRVEARSLFARVVSGECSLGEFGCHPIISNYYTQMLAPLGLTGLAVAAVTENPRTSLRRLSKVLGVQLPEEMPLVNQTQSKQRDSYEVTPGEESLILASNMADLELYNRAVIQLTSEAVD